MTEGRDRVTVVVCDRCFETAGQSPSDPAALTLLLMAHWHKSPECEASAYHLREDLLSDRARGRLTYASVEEIVEEAYARGENAANPDGPTGFAELVRELWGLIKKTRRRRASGDTEEEEDEA